MPERWQDDPLSVATARLLAIVLRPLRRFVRGVAEALDGDDDA